MELAIEKPLRYPFENEGWKKLIVGGLVSLFGSVLTFAITYAVILMFIPIGAILTNPESAEEIFRGPLMVMAQSVAMVVGIIFNLSYMPFLFGYFWETIFQARGKGEDYPQLPEWSGNVGKYFASGLKLSLYYYFLTTPVFLISLLVQASAVFSESNPMLALFAGLGGNILLIGLYIVYFFLTPFLIVPVFYNAPNVSLAQLFNVNQMLEMGKKHYGDVLLTVVVIILIQIVFGTVGIIFGVVTCCIGFLILPIVGFGVYIANGLMLLHAFELDQPDEPTQLSTQN